MAKEHNREEFVASLVRSKECISVEPGRWVIEIIKQRRSLVYLRSKLGSIDQNDVYLATYDILMRRVEMWLLRYKVQFGEHPHATLKKIVHRLNVDDTNIGIDELVSIRHSTKKNFFGVPPGALEALQRITAAFELETSS